MSTLEIGNRFVQLIKEHKNREAIDELYAESVLVNEAMEMPGRENGSFTKQSLLDFNDQFFQMMDIHDGGVEGPFPHGDTFIVYMWIDLTPKDGPMAGNRMMMKEACVYRVADGKITETHFCYPPMGG
ncbi:MAG: nuclear transport factor 2 family protein [Planctomycetota bacterium]